MDEELKKAEELLAAQMERERKMLEWIKEMRHILTRLGAVSRLGESRAAYAEHVRKFHDVILSDADTVKSANDLDDRLIRIEALL